MNIDFHAHCNSNEPGAVRAFVENCEKNNTMAALCGGLRYGAEDFQPNEEVIKICQAYPQNLIPLARIDLWDTPPDVSQLRRYADMGVKGFKFIYPWYGYDHESYMPVYEELEKLGLPALFHTGNFRPGDADTACRRPVLTNMAPIRLDAIARSFQNLKIVMAHLGTSMYREFAAELVKLHANLYFDLAGSGSFWGLSPQELAQVLKPCVFTRDYDANGFKKMIFGSDSYITRPLIQTQALEAYNICLLLNRITGEDKEAVMGGTVASWIGLK